MASVVAGPSRAARVQQWMQFARQWHVIDASHQDVNRLGSLVARYLSGKYKPIWHPLADCGDHVVVVNTRHISQHGFDWKHTLYHYDRGYPRSKADIPAFHLHEYDPCRVTYLSVYKHLGNNVIRRRHVQRLHLFPDDDIPQFVRDNLGNQLRQIRPAPRRSIDYTAEERAAMPRLVHPPDEHLLDWQAIMPHPGRHEKPPFGKAAKS